MKTDKPIKVLLDEFLASHDVMEGTRKKYRENLQYFLLWLTRNADVRDVKRSDIIAYKNHLVQSGKSAMTVDNYLVPVRLFFKFLEDMHIHDNVAAGIRSTRKNTGFRKEYLKAEQVISLLGSFDRSTLIGKRDYAIVNMMVRTGMRCVEVARTNVKDIEQNDGRWIIRIQGKGRSEKDRTLGITRTVVAPIEDYLSYDGAADNSEPAFRNHARASDHTRITTLTISKIIKKQLRRIGIDSPKITAHSLRHTAAINALKNGATILEVMSMLGHSKLETTMIYQRAIEDERMLEGSAVCKLDEVFGNDKNSGKNKQIPLVGSTRG